MTAQAQFAVIGAGGHAKVVIATIEAAGGRVVAVLDDDPTCHGALVLGHSIVGPATADMVPPGALAILAIGSNERRSAVAARLAVPFGTVVHPSAVIHASASIGAGTVVFAGAVVQPETVIGRHVIINTGASVDHDCRLGDFVHVAPGVRLAGGVGLQDGALMGIGSCAAPGALVGAWTTVGAGATVIGRLAPGITAVGSPARPVKARA